ncbi:MAG TPA: hypothetical protein H9841_07005 [Candidatus Flavonifractor merdigallinarum]|uniref:Uncharacterized protein n=1 Tax=Candidatus Flavonifractor merdigallinarum TaxID=2838589 RepID=A0A9D1Y995_9FIRM|nr:hypothetical protein [Candidatus Flavonifractor merdigallinarum]
MPEKVAPGPVQDARCIREAVCIDTKKIFDSCKDKDCIEDLRFYPTQDSQCAIDRAVSVKACKAELLSVYINVEPVSFNRGFYTVDVRYYYRVTADAFVGAARPVEISGLCVFDKRVILFGSESTAKVFSSKVSIDGPDEQFHKCNMPTAVVEAVDPIVLGIKLVDVCECRPCDCEVTEIPPCICACFGSELCFGSENRRLYVTLGQFSLIRLERDTQLLTPIYDYCVPEKECACGNSSCDEDPCEIFRHVKFPVDEFFPPNQARQGEGCYREIKNSCC